MKSFINVIVMWRHEWDVGFRGTGDPSASMEALIIETLAREEQTQFHDQTPILLDFHLDTTEVSRFMYICN